MPEDAAERTNDVPLLPIRVGSTWLALPALQVVEVVDDAEPLVLPRAPAHIPGLLNLRGTAVPLLDLRRFLDLPQIQPGEGTAFPRVVVVSAAEMTVGLRCEEVLGVIPARDRAVREPAEHPGALGRVVLAELDVVGAIASRIDLAALLESARVRG